MCGDRFVGSQPHLNHGLYGMDAMPIVPDAHLILFRLTGTGTEAFIRTL